MRYLLMTADGQLWTTNGMGIEKFAITNFHSWFCDISPDQLVDKEKFVLI
jgi:hypothetical protein